MAKMSRVVVGLVILALCGIGFEAVRQDHRARTICRQMYAEARTHADTLAVDQVRVWRSTSACADVRLP